jgi:hypothetical protein
LDHSLDTEVSAALLGFGLLTQEQRDAFAEQYNQFVFCSAQEQTKMMGHWCIQCFESGNPKARMIAEDSAEYVVSKKKRRRSRRRT